MSEKGFKQLKIDSEFQTLIRPLRRNEYRQLEMNLTVDGCRDPLITWDDVIIDGHNRYEICNRLRIPYATQEISFTSREHAIIWICSNQLGRRNITEETRKYLIGRQYEAEKLTQKNKNIDGINQFTKSDDDAETGRPTPKKRANHRRTAWRIASENHISSSTVQKYAIYSRALDAIAEKKPELMPKILSGSYKISHDNVIALAQMDDDEIEKLSRKIQEAPHAYAHYSESRKDFMDEAMEKPRERVTEVPEIKNMPALDPDAEIASLTLTIPSWISSIERAKTKAEFSAVSSSARNKLLAALEELQGKTQEMLTVVKEEI